MRLLITGGAGFIGSNFVNLLTSGELPLTTKKITVLDKLTYASNKSLIQKHIDSGAIDFVEGDICDHQEMQSLVRNHDAIINFAAESHVDNSIQDASEFVRTNVLGTQNILSAISKHSAAKVLHVSTDEVYGSIAEGSWDEHSPLDPNSPYSASKAASDLLTISMHRTHKLNAVISRCSNNYGPGQHKEKLIPKLIDQAFRNENLTLYGNGINVREWIHVDDHCRALAWILGHGKSGEIYNVGSETHLQNIEIAELVLQNIPESRSKITFIADRPGHDLRYSLNDQKIRSSGLSNLHHFNEGLSKTIEWYRSQI